MKTTAEIALEILKNEDLKYCSYSKTVASGYLELMYYLECALATLSKTIASSQSTVDRTNKYLNCEKLAKCLNQNQQ